MDRREFLKLSAIAPVVGSALLLPRVVGARGIPAESMGGRPMGLCYQGPPTGSIASTLKDLFKIGPGPSSSHTVAPIRIASNFRATVAALPVDQLAQAERIEVTLFGSLSATGKGHRTDRALLAGLLGQQPETCDTALMDALQDTTQVRTTQIGGKQFRLSGDTIVWDRGDHAFPYANTLIMRLLAGDGTSIFAREYYSTGGGFYTWKGEPPPDRGQPVHRFGSMTELKQAAAASGLPLHQIMLDNEMAIMGVSEQAVNDHLDLVIDTMDRGVTLGLTEEGLLPGPFAFYRKAKRINEKAVADGGDGFMGELSSFALAVAEGNAAGRLAVTAPTLGSAGTMPAVLYTLNHRLQIPRAAVRQGLMAAGAVGLICKTNASVAGAEMGCQAEIGVASSMAAALLAYATGAPLDVTENAATIALEHHLGMTCDPVGGFVLIPCIERNAFGAVKAYNAWLIAKNEIASQHWEDLDRVIAAMADAGRAMPARLREMGTGGLGVTMVEC
ncbi:MAG: L-serine ammonia-lyase [Lamprocystis purpurea]|jgi:L-serine dehydratase|uniref:L-serine ammonia-lyase n=1 Tax=Lamprocystis purpurea TaxID=61598 RepID=UPI00036AECD2|nr:L-serine ammonia-lyase [Lamprocystis purpurea]MBV5274990.1 L-serine ammonia-lyase [Lamprocystis purpurea]